MHIKDIDRAISMAEKTGMFEDLNNLYDNLPDGQCSGCTACCSESVPTFFIEYANIMQHMKVHRHLLEAYWPKVLEYYFTELTQKKSCPFLGEDKRCGIYEVRPLPCRLFGFSSYDDYEENLRAVEKGNREVKKYYRNAFKMELPNDVVDFKVPFCTHFIPERIIGKEERLDYSDALFSLDTKFLMRGVLDPEEINRNLVQWFAYMVFDEDSASDSRIQISREILENGTSNTLRKIIEKTPAKF